MAYKYNKTISNGAENLIEGIKNIEMFLDDNDDWNFHDSEIYSFKWERDTKALTITIEPIGFVPDIEGWDGESTILLDLHFEGCFEVHMPRVCLWDQQYIYEMGISKSGKQLECLFDGYPIKVTSQRLRVDPPRFIKDQDVNSSKQN